MGDESQRLWDVFEALAKDGAKYLRTVTTNSAQLSRARKTNRASIAVSEFGAEGEFSRRLQADEKKGTSGRSSRCNR